MYHLTNVNAYYVMYRMVFECRRFDGLRLQFISAFYRERPNMNTFVDVINKEMR